MKNIANRVLLNALIGGLAFAIIGAVCGGAVGATLGFIHDKILGYGHSYLRLYAQGGVMVGVLSGVFGAMICGTFAFYEKPERATNLLIALIGRVAVGQVLGVLGATTAFFAYELVRRQFVDERLIFLITGDEQFLLLGAPALMICGAIAAALTKRDT